MTADLHTLSGAYAADALDPVERQEFERHLAACESCQQEVRELQATAAMLAAASSEAPPTGLKDSVMAEIDQTRQERPLVADDLEARRSSRRLEPISRRIIGVAAAVLAIAVVALGATVVTLDGRLDELRATSEQLQALLAAPDTQTLALEGPDGIVGRVLVSRAEGLAVLHATGLSLLPAESDYQLWVIGEHEFVSAGILGVDDDGSVTHAIRRGLSSAVALGVTVEPAGGSPQPTSEPILTADLST